MKKVAVFSAAILGLLFGATAIAQHENKSAPASQHQAARPAQTHSQPAARPAQNQARPQQTYGGAYHGGVQTNGATFGGVHHSGVPQHAGQVRAGFVQSRATSWKGEHQTWSQRGGYNGYRIPDNRFRQYFGRDHFFRIGGLPLVFVGGTAALPIRRILGNVHGPVAGRLGRELVRERRRLSGLQRRRVLPV